MLCDAVPGDLLLAFDLADEAALGVLVEIHEGRLDGVVHRGSMLERLHDLGDRDADRLHCDVHRLQVAPGTELFEINRIHKHYAFHRAVVGPGVPPDFVPFAVEPNGMLRLEGPSSFYFGAVHPTYKAAIGVPDPTGSTGRGVTVAIVDSGVFGGALGPIPPGSINLTQGPGDDEEGHGSTIARIVGDIAPDATIVSFKVSRGRSLNAWDTLAGLYAARKAGVINLSFSFGLEDKPCPGCGFLSQTSRSAVFEAVLGRVLSSNPDTVVVVAGGNQGGDAFRFPALFPEVVAIGSVTSAGSRSPRSNYGVRTTKPNVLHPNVFYLPGGDIGESVGTTDPPTSERHGTSFAAAYASGLVAVYLGRSGLADTSRLATIAHFGQHADRAFPNDLPASARGNGFMRLP